ncbi:Sensor protein FixL [Planctomycetes bacterium MalM25]|nr:Sensor protein FixL [Planctomycetes bacterium MalM25]
MPHVSPLQLSVPYGPKRFWMRCAMVLGVILLLAGVKQLVLERTIHGMDADGSQINNSGRQRMLSQQIAKNALRIREAQPTGDPITLDRSRRELRRALDEFEAFHAGNQSLGKDQITGETNPALEGQFRELQAIHRTLVDHARGFLTEGETPDPEELLHASDRYLTGMNALTIDLANGSARRVHAARQTARWWCGATIGLIALASLFVLWPALRESHQDKRAFQEALRHLELERAAGEVLNDSLRGALALNRAVFSTAADSVIILNREGIIEQANRSAAETFAIPEERLVDSRINDLMSECDADVHDEYLKHACESTTDGVLLRNHHVRGRRSNGSQFPAELSVSKVQVAGRTVFTGILRDISERVRLEGRLAQARKMESVGQLASGIAHEINTPMQFIATNISYLDRQLTGLVDFFEGLKKARGEEFTTEERGRRVQELLDNLSEALASADIRGAIDDSLVGVNRVVEIISAMKDFAHPGTESKGVVDINHVLETAAVIARNRTKEVARVTLDLNECEEFPGVVSGLNQTFVNLLVNAADAIEEAAGEHGAMGDIRVTSRRLEEGVEVRVSDTGCGMSEEVASHAFDPFYTTKDVGKGSGQGLSIAYNAVVEQHRGRITIESAPGEGTTFRIFLPIVPAAVEVGAEDQQKAEPVG